MNITIFNPLSGHQVRGISKVADELVKHIKAHGENVYEIKIPKWLYFKNTFLNIVVFIIYQQIVCPIYAVKNRADLIIDPYNGFSIIGSIFIKTKYFIHDYTPFKRNYWYIRPGSLYQMIIFKLDILFSLAEMYHDSIDIETPNFLKRKTPINFFPCIVDSLSEVYSDFYSKNIQPIIDENKKDFLLISTISGMGWNKDFEGLKNRLLSLNREFILVAFGFGNNKTDMQLLNFNNNKTSYALKVGYVEEEAISDTIKRSDVCIFHSLNEGFGRPIIEVLKLNKPMLTINAPVVKILSIEAMSNIFLYENQEEFDRGFNAILNMKFKPFNNIYKISVCQDIEKLIN